MSAEPFGPDGRDPWAFGTSKPMCLDCCTHKRWVAGEPDGECDNCRGKDTTNRKACEEHAWSKEAKPGNGTPPKQKTTAQKRLTCFSCRQRVDTYSMVDEEGEVTLLSAHPNAFGKECKGSDAEVRDPDREEWERQERAERIREERKKGKTEADTGPLRIDPGGFVDSTEVAAEGRLIADQGIPYVVGGMIPAYGGLGFLIAYSKVGKTTLGQAMAASIASDHDEFLDRVVTACRVLYIAAEDPPDYTAWLARHLAVEKGRLTFYRRSLVLNDLTLDALATVVRDEGYGLVMIASWQSVIRGLVKDENDNAGAVEVVERVKLWARGLGIPVLIDAHAPKAEDQSDDADPTKSLRGASSAGGAADYLISLRYANNDPFSNLRRLSAKGRFVNFEPELIAYDEATGSYTKLGTTKDVARDETWTLISEKKAMTTTPKTVDQIAKAIGLVSKSNRVTGYGRKRVRNALKDRPGIITISKAEGEKRVVVLYALEPGQTDLPLDGSKR